MLFPESSYYPTFLTLTRELSIFIDSVLFLASSLIIMMILINVLIFIIKLILSHAFSKLVDILLR